MYGAWWFPLRRWSRCLSAANSSARRSCVVSAIRPQIYRAADTGLFEACLLDASGARVTGEEVHDSARAKSNQGPTLRKLDLVDQLALPVHDVVDRAATR